MTLAGWRRFVETPTADLELLSEKRWVALTGRDKQAYDETRLDDHSEMIIVATSAGPSPAPFAIPYPIAGNH
jgi:hypothetical protein